MIGFQIGKIMSYTALVILLLLSPSYSDQEIDKTTPKLVESSSLVPKLEEPENLKTDGADGDVGGKVILLYHPINTKSHRNQQNAIAEVNQNLTHNDPVALKPRPQCFFSSLKYYVVHVSCVIRDFWREATELSGYSLK